MALFPDILRPCIFVVALIVIFLVVGPLRGARKALRCVLLALSLLSLAVLWGEYRGSSFPRVRRSAGWRSVLRLSAICASALESSFEFARAHLVRPMWKGGVRASLFIMLGATVLLGLLPGVLLDSYPTSPVTLQYLRMFDAWRAAETWAAVPEVSRVMPLPVYPVPAMSYSEGRVMLNGGRPAAGASFDVYAGPTVKMPLGALVWQGTLSRDGLALITIEKRTEKTWVRGRVFRVEVAGKSTYIILSP